MYGFIYSSLDSGVIYDGDALDLINVIGKRDAITFYENAENCVDIDIEEVSYQALGESWTFRIPMFTGDKKEIADRGYVDRTSEMVDYITKQSNVGYFNGEKTYLFWMNFLKRYKVYGKGMDEAAVHGFYYEGLPDGATDEHRPDKYGLSAERMLLKQFLDGYYMYKPVKVLNKGSVAELTIYDNDRKIKINKKNMSAFGTYFIQYSNATYKNMKFYKKTQKADEIKRGLKSGEGKGKYRFSCRSNAYYNLAGTTIISGCRRLGKTMFGADLAINTCISQDYFDPNREKVVVFFSYSQDQCYKFREHILKLMGDYVKTGWLEEKGENIEFYEPFERMEGGKTIMDKKVIGKIICKTANGKNPGVGDGADLYILDEPERYDERKDSRGNKIDGLTYIYDNILQTFDEFPNTRILIISTQNEEGRTDTEFYKMLRQGESAEFERQENNETIDELLRQYVEKYELWKYKDIHDLFERADFDIEEMINNRKYEREITGIRISGRENEMRTTKQLKRQAETLKKRNYVKYCTEFECFSPYSSKLIYVNRSIMQKETMWANKFDFIVPVFDMGASGSDNRGYVCLGYDYNPGQSHNRICLLSEDEIGGKSSQQIAKVHENVMRDCKRWLKNPQSENYFLVYDSRGVGDDREAYFENHGLKIALKFSSVAARSRHQDLESINKNLTGEEHVDFMDVYYKQSPDDLRKRHVDKTTNINNSIFYMNNNYFALDERETPISSKEMRSMKRYFTKTSYTYKAEGRKNDGVFLAISMGMFYITKIMQFDRLMAAKRHDQIHQIIAQHIRKNNAILNEEQKKRIQTTDDMIPDEDEYEDENSYETMRLKYSRLLGR